MYRCLPSGYRITLKRNENYNSHIVFCSNSPKSGPTSSFFLLNFQGYRPFFEQFSEKKKSNFFRQKYPKAVTTNFVKVDSKKKYIFLKWILPFTEVKWLVLSYLFPKNRKISHGMVSFFVWYQRFFTRKSFSG